MEIHQLKYFLAVAEERSFSRAAERMRVAQPSLSQQIQKLEAEVGQRLFDRLSRSISITEAGLGLLPFARRILTELADAKRSVEDCGAEAAGKVALGIIPTIAPYLTGPLLATLAKEHARITVDVLEDVSDNLVRAVQDGEIDLALLSTCRSGGGVHRQILCTEPLLAAVREGHRLAKRADISWSKLRDEAFLLLHETHCLSEQIRAAAERHKVQLRPTLSAVQISTILAMVAAGRGITLVPAMAVPYESHRGCVFLPFQPSAPGREINLLRNAARYQSKAAVVVCELARRMVNEPARASQSRARHH